MLPVADFNLKEFLELAQTSSKIHHTFRIREWFGCLAAAVQYLHGNRIRHRDIKPANILVKGLNILLVDFELALDWKDLDQSTTTAYCGRTPLYAAPEVINLRKCNSTSDIWSLGCVFLEMATVLKGKRIDELREHFISLTESKCFFNNLRGIHTWISILAAVSNADNAPLMWISKMLQAKNRCGS
jgi:serine/threonine protein kinase